MPEVIGAGDLPRPIVENQGRIVDINGETGIRHPEINRVAPRSAAERHDMIGVMFIFPEDVRWNDREEAVEFDVRLGDYEGKVLVPRRVFQGLSGARPKAEQCIEYFHLNRTSFERIAEEKIRARQLDWDANIRISGRDLRVFKR